MKKVTKTLMVGALLASMLISPAFAQGQKDSGATSAKKKVIAGVVFQEDQFFKTVSAGYKAAAKDYGYELLQANTTMDQSKENEIVNTYLAQNIAGLAIAPMSNDISPATLGDAAKAGLKMVVCNINLDNFPFAAAAFTADNYSFCHQTGEIAAKYFKENNPSGAVLKAGIIQFKTQFPEQANARVTGFFDALTEGGIKYEIVADQDAWLQDMAVAKCGDMLAANPNIDFIFAANDGGTVGSAMAVQNAGLEGKTVVFGTDASEQIVSLLQDDTNILQAVTGQDAFHIGYNSVEALVQYIEGKDFEAKGKTNIIAGTPLVRGDEAGLQAFLADMKSRM
jgi:simple sugar transport system substrate-binding protein